MKLMAAGIELEEAALPANFRHESVSCDADALQIIETFDKESKRAQLALRMAGAVDDDGHLTEYGRELERFPGTGSEALGARPSNSPKSVASYSARKILIECVDSWRIPIPV